MYLQVKNILQKTIYHISKQALPSCLGLRPKREWLKFNYFFYKKNYFNIFLNKKYILKNH